MSFSTLKRVFGETNLERKCRWLLGVGTLLLMSASFFFYAHQTENLAFDQLTHTGRTLVTPIVSRTHVRQNKELLDGMDEFQKLSEQNWPDQLKSYTYRFILPNSTTPDRRPTADDQAVLRTFKENPAYNEETKHVPSQSLFIYNGAIRAGQSCVHCHQSEEKLALMLGNTLEARKTAKELADPNLQPGDLMGIVRVELSTDVIEGGLHQNRALLITFAVSTTLLILAGSYAVIRYVVVRPVKHLKSVSEAIAAGQITVRSEIHTGDEFEDLSIAFNRMLTNLIQMQQRNRNLIADLDKKIDELARVNLELHQTNKIKTDFLSMMSHELRTPLNHIIGFSEMLLNADNLSDKQQRHAAYIHTAGQQLLSLIGDVLDLAKMESGKMRVRPAYFNVRQLCEHIGTMFRPSAEKKNIELLLELPLGAVPAHQDAGKLRQIISNLLSNAVKFTPEGGRITLSLSSTPETLIFTVSDTGIGIALEEQEMVFQKFRQVSDTTITREQGGTGLGLSIVRELAKLLGGNVTLQSELGRGSTFIVSVSRDLPNDPMAEFESATNAANPPIPANV